MGPERCRVIASDLSLAEGKVWTQTFRGVSRGVPIRPGASAVSLLGPSLPHLAWPAVAHPRGLCGTQNVVRAASGISGALQDGSRSLATSISGLLAGKMGERGSAQAEAAADKGGFVVSCQKCEERAGHS